MKAERWIEMGGTMTKVIELDQYRRRSDEKLSTQSAKRAQLQRALGKHVIIMEDNGPSPNVDMTDEELASFRTRLQAAMEELWPQAG